MNFLSISSQKGTVTGEMLLLYSLRLGDASGIVNIPHILSLLYVTNWSLWQQSCFLKTSSLSEILKGLFTKKGCNFKTLFNGLWFEKNGLLQAA